MQVLKIAVSNVVMDRELNISSTSGGVSVQVLRTAISNVVVRTKLSSISSGVN